MAGPGQSSTCNCFLLFGSSIAQIFLVILNIGTALLGIGLIAVGSYIKNNDLIDPNIMDLLNEIDLGGFNLGDLIDALASMIITIGVFALLLSLLAIFAAAFKVRCLLITYSVILVAIIIFEVVVLGLWCNFINGINEWLRDKFEYLLKHYNGQQSKDLYSQGWNFVFMLFDCCAVTPVTTSYNDFRDLPSDWWSSSSRGSDVIPYTCCTEATIDNYWNGTKTSCTEFLQDFSTSGCYDVFNDLFNELAQTAISITTILVLIEVAAIVSAIFIIVYVFKNIAMSKGTVIPHIYASELGETGAARNQGETNTTQDPLSHVWSAPKGDSYKRRESETQQKDVVQGNSMMMVT